MADETTVIIPSEKDTIDMVRQTVEKLQKARSQFERGWLTDIAFLYGKQYFSVEKRPLSGLDERIHWELKNLERKKKSRRTANYILPLFRSLLARMLMMKAHINIEPNTNTERDIAAARVSQEVLENFWQSVNKNNSVLCQDYVSMLGILEKLFSYMLTVGCGYLKPYFNKNTTTKTFLSDEVVEAEIGEVEVEVDHPFNIFPDPLKKSLIQKKVLSIEDIEANYGVEVEAEDIGLTDVERQLLSLLEGQSEERYENASEVYNYYSLPNKKYPDGRWVVSTKSKLILDEVLPEEYKGRIPFFKFNYLDFMLAPYPQGMVEQLISLQEEYNFTISRLAEYKKWFAGKIKAPINCKLQTKYDDQVGQIIKYDPSFGEPKFETPPSPPTFLTQEINRIRRDMEDAAGVHDTSLGRIPDQAKSGVAIENLSDLDNSQLAPILIRTEQQLAFFSEMVLDIVEKRYVEPRILGITGENLGPEVKTFLGENVQGNRRIKISLGSGMPSSKTERQKFIMELAGKQFITKQKAMELMEFGDLEGIYHSADEASAKSENQEMLKGGSWPQPQQFEDHTTHLKVLQDFMKSKQFRLLPEELRNAFLAHQEGHQEFLRVEMDAARQMEQGQTQGGR